MAVINIDRKTTPTGHRPTQLDWNERMEFERSEQELWRSQDSTYFAPFPVAKMAEFAPHFSRAKRPKLRAKHFGSGLAYLPPAPERPGFVLYSLSGGIKDIVTGFVDERV